MFSNHDPSSVPRHRLIEPTKSCMKGNGKQIRSICIRETPERRLISPRSEESRANFYTDEEYDRFQREATSIAWLLEGAADSDGGDDAGLEAHATFFPAQRPVDAARSLPGDINRDTAAMNGMSGMSTPGNRR